jgi:hypothetical protein
MSIVRKGPYAKRVLRNCSVSCCYFDTGTTKGMGFICNFCPAIIQGRNIKLSRYVMFSKPAYFRSVTPAARTRIKVYLHRAQIVVAEIISYFPPANYYDKGHWDKTRKSWNITHAHEQTALQTFLASCTPCAASEFHTAEHERSIASDK